MAGARGMDGMRATLCAHAREGAGGMRAGVCTRGAGVCEIGVCTRGSARADPREDEYARGGSAARFGRISELVKHT